MNNLSPEQIATIKAEIKRLEEDHNVCTDQGLQKVIDARIAEYKKKLAIPADGKTKKRWLELCEQASTEQDPKKLMELVEEIDRILKEKQDGINQGRNNAAD
jgi:hypothetical protein